MIYEETSESDDGEVYYRNRLKFNTDQYDDDQYDDEYRPVSLVQPSRPRFTQPRIQPVLPFGFRSNESEEEKKKAEKERLDAQFKAAVAEKRAKEAEMKRLREIEEQSQVKGISSAWSKSKKKRNPNPKIRHMGSKAELDEQRKIQKIAAAGARSKRSETAAMTAERYQELERYGSSDINYKDRIKSQLESERQKRKDQLERQKNWTSKTYGGISVAKPLSREIREETKEIFINKPLEPVEYTKPVEYTEPVEYTRTKIMLDIPQMEFSEPTLQVEAEPLPEALATKFRPSPKFRPTTTDHLSFGSEYFESLEKCKQMTQEYKRNYKQTNPRYINFTQLHFTAGDEEQFRKYIVWKNGEKPCINNPVPSQNLWLANSVIRPWDKNSNVSALAVVNTFKYIFHKFKKGIFVQIRDNSLVTFLPFSKAKFENEWASRIQVDPRKYRSMIDFIEAVDNSTRFGKFNRDFVNRDISGWNANNCILRYDGYYNRRTNTFLPNEGEHGVSILKNMLIELCKYRAIPDIDLFMNRRDFPLITRDETEPYNHIWDSKEKPLISHNYSKYIPIFSPSSGDRYADIPIPTQDDWERVQSQQSIFFPGSCKLVEDQFDTPWEEKIPEAVFRGTSTGCGTTIDTNQRLKAVYLSKQQEYQGYLDAEITKWQARIRKLEGEKYLKYVDIENLPFQTGKFMSPKEQSKYKYILHIAGHTSAFRLSLEMAMGSVILLVDNPWRLWIQDSIKPYVHYVPILSDLSDLKDKIIWCKEHDSKCQTIAMNARSFYQTYLGKDGILDFLQKAMIECKNNMGNYMYNIKSPYDIQQECEQRCLSLWHPPRPFFSVDGTVPPAVPFRIHNMQEGIEWYINLLYSQNVAFSRYNSNQIASNKLSVLNRLFIGDFSVIVKTSSDANKVREDINEAFIGKNCINNLTDEVPNFAYIYGMMNIGTFIEYIPGSTFSEYIKNNFSFEEYIIILVQLSFALRIAQKRCCFTHNDLTPWNIMIIRHEEMQEIDYVIRYDRVVRVKSKIVPVIIDYGKSKVVYKGKHYGIVNPTKFSSIDDILMILIKSLEYMIEIPQILKKYQNEILYLANFMTGTSYQSEPFRSISDLKRFLKSRGRFSRFIHEDKGAELNQRTTEYFIRHLTGGQKKFPVFKNIFTTSVMYRKSATKNSILALSNSRQVYDFLSATNFKAQISSYMNVFKKFLSSRLPIYGNLLMRYYAAQRFEDNLTSVYANLLNFLKESGSNSYQVEAQRLYSQTIEFMHSQFDKSLTDTEPKPFAEIDIPKLSRLFVSFDDYLDPAIIKKCIASTEKFENLEKISKSDIPSLLKNLESIFTCENKYKLPSHVRSYYKNNLDDILNMDIVGFNCALADNNTVQSIAKSVYSTNMLYPQFQNCPNDIYTSILSELDFTYPKLTVIISDKSLITEFTTGDTNLSFVHNEIRYKFRMDVSEFCKSIQQNPMIELIIISDIPGLGGYIDVPDLTIIQEVPSIVLGIYSISIGINSSENIEEVWDIDLASSILYPKVLMTLYDYLIDIVNSDIPPERYLTSYPFNVYYNPDKDIQEEN